MTDTLWCELIVLMKRIIGRPEGILNIPEHNALLLHILPVLSHGRGKGCEEEE